jgi:hypothetical protein
MAATQLTRMAAITANAFADISSLTHAAPKPCVRWPVSVEAPLALGRKADCRKAGGLITGGHNAHHFCSYFHSKV